MCPPHPGEMGWWGGDGAREGMGEGSRSKDGQAAGGKRRPGGGDAVPGGSPGGAGEGVVPVEARRGGLSGGLAGGLGTGHPWLCSPLARMG